jgi:rubrerythrin
MDLTRYDLNVLLLTAIKSEVDSKAAYSKLAKRVKNALLKDKLEFLANEEEKHRAFIEDIYRNHFPGKKIKLPKETSVPLPEIQISDENIPLSRVLRSAMEAEHAASEFYKKLSQRFLDDKKIKTTLLYFANMELGHYKLLEIEKENIERFEESDVYWPMVHAGP